MCLFFPPSSSQHSSQRFARIGANSPQQERKERKRKNEGRKKQTPKKINNVNEKKRKRRSAVQDDPRPILRPKKNNKTLLKRCFKLQGRKTRTPKLGILLIRFTTHKTKKKKTGRPTSRPRAPRTNQNICVQAFTSSTSSLSVASSLLTPHVTLHT